MGNPQSVPAFGIQKGFFVMAVQLTPHFGNVQAHYDLSDDFFRLFLDPSQTYSCAYFERDDMTLEEAQLAKIDLSLSKLGLEPGMTLLDIGCGWGATLRRAIEKYDVNVVGLTLSENQAEHVQKSFDQLDTTRTRRVLLEGWEKFDEPVDRIVSIGAFEHFGRARWARFFEMAYSVLPANGVMMLHTIVRPSFKEARANGLPLTREVVHFTQFILAEIFPAAGCPPRRWWKSTLRMPALISPEPSPCSCTTRAPWTCGRPRWKPIRTRRSRSSHKRSTTAT